MMKPELPKLKIQTRLEKLIDGELDHRARSNWIDELSEDSPEWREIALAFIEHQVFCESLGEPLGDLIPSSLNSNLAPQTNDNGQIVEVQHCTKDQSGSRTIRKRWLFWLTGLAACLMAGFFIGLNLEKGAVQSAQQIEEKTTPNIQVKKDFEAKRLADALSRTMLPLPQEFRRAMLRAGYEMSDQQTITEVTLPNGGAIEMPIRKVDVQYVGLNAYQ